MPSRVRPRNFFSNDRLGRSLQDLVGFLSELQALAKSFRSLKRTPTLRSSLKSKLTRRHVEVDNDAAIASGENADRKREIAFTCDPFMFFSDTLNAVAGVARLSVRGRNKMTAL
jgi:hypothetical protein